MDTTFKIDNQIFNYRVAGVFIKNGHVLLHKPVTADYWILPGGRVKVLEDSKAALIREIKEELGLDAEVDRLLWFTENFFSYEERKFHEIGLYYKISSKETINFTKEAFYGIEDEDFIYKWIPLDELDYLVLQPRFLQTALKDLPVNTQHLILRN